MAKNRIKQRENRRYKEEKLDLHDYFGMKDSTPFAAVRNMIRRGESAADYRKARIAV